MKGSPVYSVFPVRIGPVSGWVLAVEWQGRVSALRFPFKGRGDLREWLGQEHPGAREDKTGLLGAVEREVRKYFQGENLIEFRFPLDFSGYTDFQRRVLRETRKIPYGRTATYRQLAGRAGAPGAFRAVGQALGANQHLILVPCHRVIRTDGNPGGFSAPGGGAVKVLLLELEKAQCFDSQLR